MRQAANGKQADNHSQDGRQQQPTCSTNAIALAIKAMAPVYTSPIRIYINILLLIQYAL